MENQEEKSFGRKMLAFARDAIGYQIKSVLSFVGIYIASFQTLASVHPTLALGACVGAMTAWMFVDEAPDSKDAREKLRVGILKIAFHQAKYAVAGVAVAGVFLQHMHNKQSAKESQNAVQPAEKDLPDAKGPSPKP